MTREIPSSEVVKHSLEKGHRVSGAPESQDPLPGPDTACITQVVEINCYTFFLNVKTEVYNIAIMDDVILAF